MFFNEGDVAVVNIADNLRALFFRQKKRPEHSNAQKQRAGEEKDIEEDRTDNIHVAIVWEDGIIRRSFLPACPLFFARESGAELFWWIF